MNLAQVVTDLYQYYFDVEVQIVEITKTGLFVQMPEVEERLLKGTDFDAFQTWVEELADHGLYGETDGSRVYYEFL